MGSGCNVFFENLTLTSKTYLTENHNIYYLTDYSSNIIILIVCFNKRPAMLVITIVFDVWTNWYTKKINEVWKYVIYSHIIYSALIIEDKTGVIP